MKWCISLLLSVIFCHCISGEVRTKEILCESNDKPCGGWGCYNPDTETCHHLGEDRKKCKKEESLCRRYGYGNCYSKKTHVCLEGTGRWGSTLVVCLKGETLCGEECFNPENLACEDGKICQKGFKTCGYGKEIQCYDPSEFQCSSGKLCNVNEKACNGVCYPASLTKKCFRINYNYPFDEVTSYASLW